MRRGGSIVPRLLGLVTVLSVLTMGGGHGRGRVGGSWFDDLALSLEWVGRVACASELARRSRQ